ncbi:MAG: hypothetical protein KDA78_12135 [Planctomycetaceae bacterium]|nr:hypothetical protein [Planctomycetaceae bacterium]
MSTSKQSNSQDGSENARRKKDLLPQNCDWITKTLKETGRVRRSEFNKHVKQEILTEGATREINEKTLSSDWSIASRCVHAVLRSLGYPVTIIGSGENAEIITQGGFTQQRYANRFFDPEADVEQKKAIGNLVAQFLKRVDDRHVFLGSGSTVLHIGRAMKELSDLEGPYRQLFWTINVALAAEWAEQSNPPVSRLLIPEGQLRTITYRFASVREPKWFCPIVVVSADGCYYDERKGVASLFANESSVAENTNLFMNRAVDCVICCLSSNKIEYHKGRGQNAGPPIYSPNDTEVEKARESGVKWFLVTDGMPKHPEKIEALRKKCGWNVVTSVTDWNQYDRIPLDFG